MRVILVYSADPIYISPLIQRIVQEHTAHIIGVMETQGSLVRRKTRWQQIEYLLALLVILGIARYLGMIWRVLFDKQRQTQAIQDFCRAQNIPYETVKTVNSKSAVAWLTALQPDLIFNQSHHIIQKRVLDVPRIGVLNRHGALLPDYRGRLSPFWQLVHCEENGGLTYHLMDEDIDSGAIVYQEAIPISQGETVHSLAKKGFVLAADRFTTVLDILSKPDYAAHLIDNPADEGRYFSSPRLMDALRYRFKRC